MSQVTYMAPVSEVRGKLCLNRGNDSVMVTRRKCFGKTKNGHTPPRSQRNVCLSFPQRSLVARHHFSSRAI